MTTPDLTLAGLDDLMTSYMTAVNKGSHLEQGWLGGFAGSYCVSKMGVSALARVLARTTGDSVVVNHVHPGYVVTDMNRHLPSGPHTAIPLNRYTHF